MRGQASLFGPEGDTWLRGQIARRESSVVDADEGAIEQRFGRGRPKGARNVASEKRLELFARISGDPLLASARVLAMSLDELAVMLGCTVTYAAEFQQRERYLAMPYVISKRPQEVNLNTNAPPALHLHFPQPAAMPPGQALPLGAGGAVALLAHHARALHGEILPPMHTPQEDQEETET